MRKIELKYSELTFWHYQWTGFIILCVADILRSLEFWFSTTGSIILMIFTYSSFFCLTLLLRYVYRPLYNLKKPMLLYLLLTCGISYITSALSLELGIFVRPFLIDEQYTWLAYNRNFEYLTQILTNSWSFFVWSILYFNVKYWRDLVAETERSKASSLLATTAQLQMLRYQINPHFLFNSLNSIKALTYENPEQAGVMLTELSEFLRTTLSYNGMVFVPIKEEIEIIEKYLSIEKIRFEERLNYKINYDKIILEKEILCFITQPIVENAIKHGLTNNPAGIDININFSKIEDYLSIEIENTGVLKDHDNSNGTGLKNILERLDNAYSKQYIFSINDDNGVVKIRLLIPDES